MAFGYLMQFSSPARYTVYADLKSPARFLKLANGGEGLSQVAALFAQVQYLNRLQTIYMMCHGRAPPQAPSSGALVPATPPAQSHLRAAGAAAAGSVPRRAAADHAPACVCVARPTACPRLRFRPRPRPAAHQAST